MSASTWSFNSNNPHLMVNSDMWVQVTTAVTQSVQRLGYEVNGPGFRVRVPAKARDFSLLQNVKTGSGSHTASCSMGKGVRSWGLKGPGRDVNQAPLSSAQLKCDWSYTSIPLCAFTAWLEKMHPLKVRCQNCERRLSASSCQSVRPPAWNNSAPTRRISMKFDTSCFFEIPSTDSG
jgi:hypothetical protein